MAFIGNNLGSITTEARTVDTMVGDGSTATLTLTKTPGSVNNVEVFYDGIFQTPGEDFTLAGSTLTFTTAPTTGINVVAISGDDSQVVFPDANSITTKKILDNTITSDKIVDIAAEKLSGILPVVDGSAVTGMNLPDAVDLTTSASNPTRTMNKPVGSLAVNSTSGEMFILTDDETDNNTWMNVGLGNTDVTYTPPWDFGGIISGFTSGGRGYNTIDKFSFSSNGNAIDHSDITGARWYCSNSSSETHGYTTGGYNGAVVNVIDKFPFSSNTNATDIGDISGVRYSQSGQSSETHGYSSGGNGNIIDKFSFSTDGNATNVGSLSVFRHYPTGNSSTTHGYASSGSEVNVIDKFSFASGGTATDVGDLTQHRLSPAGQSSSTHGYCSGGAGYNIIDKFSFSSDANAVDSGDLTRVVSWPTGISSTTYGYTAGGTDGTWQNIIDRFNFSGGGSAGDVGDLTVAREGGMGHQY